MIAKLDKRILKKARGWLMDANDIWDLSAEMKGVYDDAISDCPKNFDRGKILNPKSLEDVTANTKLFFPRHFLKLQHTFYDLVSWGYHALEDGELTVLDIGCGPGTASLAALDLYFQIFCAYELEEQNYPYSLPFRFKFILVDNSQHCLLKATNLITNYLQHITTNLSFTESYIEIHPSIVTIKGAYPEVIPEIKKVLAYTGQANLVCYSNILVPLINSLKCDEGQEGLCLFCDNVNTRDCTANKNIRKSEADMNFVRHKNYTQYVIVQEKKHWNLIQPILPHENLNASLVNMKQKNYDSRYTFESYNTTYGRALYHTISHKNK